MYRPEWDLPSLRVEFDLEQLSGHLEGTFLYSTMQKLSFIVSRLIIRKF